MLTLRVDADDFHIALQDLDTDDFENCNFAKKFTSETNENMEKLMACVGHKNHPSYSKTQLLCLYNMSDIFNVQHKPLVFPYFQ